MYTLHTKSWEVSGQEGGDTDILINDLPNGLQKDLCESVYGRHLEKV